MLSGLNLSRSGWVLNIRYPVLNIVGEFYFRKANVRFINVFPNLKWPVTRFIIILASMQKEKKKIEVVAAIIKHNNKILCVQRGENKFDYISKKYEFPGGKIEAGETKEQTIIREILEELHMHISTQEEFLTVEHEYPDFYLTMHSFICSCEDPNFQLTEHIDFKWLEISEMGELDWAGADVPIVEKLMK